MLGSQVKPLLNSPIVTPALRKKINFLLNSSFATMRQIEELARIYWNIAKKMVSSAGAIFVAMESLKESLSVVRMRVLCVHVVEIYV